MAYTKISNGSNEIKTGSDQKEPALISSDRFQQGKQNMTNVKPKWCNLFRSVRFQELAYYFFWTMGLSLLGTSKKFFEQKERNMHFRSFGTGRKQNNSANAISYTLKTIIIPNKKNSTCSNHCKTADSEYLS